MLVLLFLGAHFFFRSDIIRLGSSLKELLIPLIACFALNYTGFYFLISSTDYVGLVIGVGLWSLACLAVGVKYLVPIFGKI